MVRVKRRYIVFRLETKKKAAAPPKDQDFLGELLKQVAQTYGDFGVGCLKRGHAIKRQDTNGYMILQVRLGVEEMVMSVMPLITKIGDIPCRLNIIHLSGTIRGSLKQLRLNYIRNLRASISKKLKSKSQQHQQQDNSSIVKTS